MKVQQQVLCAICSLILALPMLASAEIYKWKDKNGVMRYSDTPPPTSVKVDTLGKKRRPVPAVRPDMASEPPKAAAQPVAPQDGKPPAKFKDPVEDPEMEAAKQRAKQAEIERQNKQSREEQAKINEENCKAAKANYQSFAQGGRVYKMNENGERVYMDDEKLEEGKAKAQAEIQQYCN